MILFRYLAREVFSAFLCILLVLLILLMSNQFLHYVSLAAQGYITVSVVFRIMSFQVPLLLSYLLPIAFYISVIVVYGRFYAESEMLAMKSGGLSPLRLLILTLSMALVVAVCSSYLMLSVVPDLQWARKKLLADAQATASIAKVMPSRFQSLPRNNGVIFAQSVSYGHPRKLQHVFYAHQPNQDQQWSVLSAQSAQQETIQDQQAVVFKHGALYQLGSNIKGTTINYFDTFVQWLQPVSVKPATGSIKFIPTRALLNNLHRPDYVSEWQWRLSFPLSIFILALFAWYLSPVNPRQSKYQHIFQASAIYLLYFNLLFLGRRWLSEGVLSLSWGLWWVHALMLGLFVCMLGGRRMKLGQLGV